MQRTASYPNKKRDSAIQQTKLQRKHYVFKENFHTISEIWSGLWTDRSKVTLAIPIVIVLAIDAIIEALIMPYLYKGIPMPYSGGTKPIGGVLFVATFFHLLVITASIIVVLYAARRLGLRAGEVLPKSRGGWADLFFLMLLLVSGLISWFNPVALVGFIVSGIYLVAAELD